MHAKIDINTILSKGCSQCMDLEQTKRKNCGSYAQHIHVYVKVKAI